MQRSKGGNGKEREGDAGENRVAAKLISHEKGK